jgi:hypothetical protein
LLCLDPTDPPHGSLVSERIELNQLSGVAAILNFPLDVEVAEEEDRLERERAAEEEKDRAHAEAIS